MNWYSGINAIISAAIGSVVVLAGSYWTEANKSRELDIKMVEIAIGILREENDEKGKLVAAKGWAVEVINEHSEVDISAEARAELVQTPLKMRVQGKWYGWDDPNIAPGGSGVIAGPYVLQPLWNTPKPNTPVIKPDEVPNQQ